jgi:hypothetical protein
LAEGSVARRAAAPARGIVLASAPMAGAAAMPAPAAVTPARKVRRPTVPFPDFVFMALSHVFFLHRR